MNVCGFFLLEINALSMQKAENVGEKQLKHIYSVSTVSTDLLNKQ